MPRKYNPLPPQGVLKDWFDYDPESGTFIWKKRPANCVHIGQVAGTLEGRGYWQMRVPGFGMFKASRLAWMYIYGNDPDDLQIDHSDGNKLNNAISNLRLATNAENGRNRGVASNNRSGLKGVRLRVGTRKWEARIRVNGVEIYLGLHSTAESAHAAYCKAATEHFGEFARNVSSVQT